jgi:HlyB family type I secretion system ABC transporter
MDSSGDVDPGERRIAAVAAAARFCGVELDRLRLKEEMPAAASPPSLVAWLTEAGLWARAVRLGWRQLADAAPNRPIVLLFKDGGAGLLVAADAARDLAWLKDPADPEGAPVAMDALRLSQWWSGDALLVRRGQTAEQKERPFGFGMVARQVLGDGETLRQIGLASLVLSLLAIVPALLTSIVLDRVLVYQSWSTLELVTLIVLITVLFEILLTHARGEALQVLSTRIDARLNLLVFDRLLALPLDYFERHPTGETNHRIGQIFKIRSFLTGKLMSTALDGITLFVLLPVVFWLQPVLAALTLVASCVVAGIIAAFLPAMRHAYARVISAEVRKSGLMVETVQGIRTVKSLVLESQRREAWDQAVAEAGLAQLAAGRLARWPRTLSLPAERFIDRGVLLVAAFLVLDGVSSIQVGALVAFVMLSGRLAAPLVGFARLLEDVEEVRTAVQQVGQVLNNPTEAEAMRNGVSPKISGALQFEGVSFTYPGARRPALDNVSFDVPAGNVIGVVGRSGSGKSTLTRVLQGISRSYDGTVRIDGTDLREINLAHLRRSFGIVLQDNVLFRGTVADNILAGRPNLTLEDAMEAARLAGAEEFIERMPQGYQTWIEEGSSNLSGGQRQRLAIARALVADPPVLILDEATSALDPESEAVVNENLRRIARGRTTVIISHRLSSLLDCDLIAVLDHGRLVDLAHHEVLVERCDIYSQLWRQQNRHLGNLSAARQPLARVGG